MNEDSKRYHYAHQLTELAIISKFALDEFDALVKGLMTENQNMQSACASLGLMQGRRTDVAASVPKFTSTNDIEKLRSFLQNLIGV